MEFTGIFKTYQTPLYNYILRMVGDTYAAEDLTQETFIKIYKNLSGFRGESSLKTWIFQIATNITLDYFRTSAYKNSKRTDIIEDEEEIYSAGIGEAEKVLSIEDKLIKTEMSQCVRDFIDQLPEDYKAVIILHDLQDFKNREIADILGESLDNVKIRLHRARKKLRSVLASYCNFYRDKNNNLRCDRKGEDCL